MELEGPKNSLPAILALGVASADWRGLERLCHDSGVLVDRADSREEALDSFLRRGGHEGVLLARSGDAELGTVQTLRAIDPELRVWNLGVSVSELTATVLREMLATDTPRLS